MGQIDVLMLGWLRDTTEAGIYVIVARIAGLVTLPLTAVNMAFAPTIAALHARGERDRLQSTVTMTSWWITLGALAIALPLFAAAGFWLSWFGAAFVAGAAGLQIMLCAQLVHGLTGSIGSSWS